MGKIVSSDNNVGMHQQFMGKIYSAQGQLMIGETEEASKILSRLLIENDIKKDKDQQLRHALTFARVAMASNDINKAETQLSKAGEVDSSRPEFVLTNIAYELQRRRHSAKAQQILLNYNATQNQQQN